MSERRVEPDHGSFGTSGQSYQSAWMAHWKQKHSTSKPDSETRDFPSPIQKIGDVELQTSSSGPEITASTSKFANESRKNSGSRLVSAMNDNLKSSGLKFNQEKGDNRFFPMFNLSETEKENVGSCSKITPYEKNSNCHSIQGLPLSVEDVETMRICTTVDSTENVFGGPSKLHKATHHFMFTKRTGFNMSEGGQVFTESSVSTKFKGKMLSEFLNMSPNFKFQSHHGLNLLPPPGCEGKETVNSSKLSLKNEASVETDTMEMDYIQRNHLSDADLSPLCKNILGAQNSATSQALVGSTLEGNENDLPCTNIPDINEEPPALPDDGETSSSRTQSLDMDHLLSHPTNFKSTDKADEITGPEPSCSWAKRLKLSSKGSEPTDGAHISNKLVLKEDTWSSLDSVRKDEETLLSNPWIRRWCRSAAPQKKAESVMELSEPERSSFNDFQNKQFPSIAAMALLGKALNGFQPCEFKKRDCLVVWNTK